MKYLIVGNGWLGNMMSEYLFTDAAITPKRLDEITVADLEPYDAVINCAAKTNIDWCEKNRLDTYKANVADALSLAYRVKEAGKKHVFMSSACIFESKGRKDLKNESSTPNPQCWYAETKAEAERKILAVDPTTLVIRIRLPLSETPHPRNTINKLLSYPLINNKQESVTVIEDALPVIRDLIIQNETGVFHLVNEGTVSPAEIARHMGHTFTEISKTKQNQMLKEQGRAKRVTTYVVSKRIPLLPNIEVRIRELAVQYKLKK